MKTVRLCDRHSRRPQEITQNLCLRSQEGWLNKADKLGRQIASPRDPVAMMSEISPHITGSVHPRNADGQRPGQTCRDIDTFLRGWEG